LQQDGPNNALSGVKANTVCLRLSNPSKLLCRFLSKVFDCDNGSEFMNWTILKHFQDRKRPVHYTRSREYQKNDNAHIEGKNWTHIRQYLGYDRFEDQHLVALMNNLYSSEWRLLFNFFLPSVKLLAKERLKSKTFKRFDIPKTPFQRLLESKDVSQNTKDELLRILKSFLSSKDYIKENSYHLTSCYTLE
jgi:hypothetical protein